MSTSPSVPPLRVLVVHCHYREPGGEDVVVANEVALLREHGHEVETLVRANAELLTDTALRRAHAAARTIWSRSASADLAREIQRFRPDVVHVHNTFQQLSPVVYRVCADAGVPVVQTLHNYRYGCVSTNLFRDGQPCFDCVGKPVALPGVQHACYRDSRAQSGVVAAMTAVHRAARSWTMVSRYIATSAAARAHFVAMGLPADKVVVKPNFVAKDPGPRAAGDGDYLLYAGRLIVEKGVRDLVEAAAGSPLPLWMVGDGPLSAELQRRIETSALPVTLLGARPHEDVQDMIRRARAVVVPSLWDEPFGLVVIEAYANGVPVIASDRGALPELVEDGVTGTIVAAGDVPALQQALRGAAERPELLAEQGEAARTRYETAYSADVNYTALTGIYADAIASG